MKKAIGTHLIADVQGMTPSLLRDRSSTARALQRALEKWGLNILQSSAHDFPGGGFTVCFLLSESHASLHSYPELHYLAVDLFTCGATNPRKVLQSFLEALNHSDCDVTVVERHARVPDSLPAPPESP